jgi:flagellar biosynthesis chaperone FliJ
VNGFVFSLSALLKFRKNRRDHCQRLLAQVLADEAGLIAQRETLIAARERQFEEIRQLSRRGHVTVDGTAMRRFHSLQLLAGVHGVDEKRQLVAQQLHLCRQALSKADAEVKVLERLEEKQRAAFLYDAERRAQLEREDAWTSRWLLEKAR